MGEYIIQVANICRNRYNSVNYVIAGDINQDNLDQLHSLDLEERVQLPTRGQSHLDLVWSNLSKSQSWTQAPLRPFDGNGSDHNMGFVDLILPPPSKVWHYVSRRLVSEERFPAYSEELSWVDWQHMVHLSLDEQADFFNTILTSLADKYFP